MKRSILGIDVSKKELVIALLQNNKRNSSAVFSNDLVGFKGLDQWLKRKVKDGDLLACAEATGRYSDGIANYLHSQSYNVSIVNPFCIKAYAQSRLSRHKTDKVDANIIAEYATFNDVRLYTPMCENKKNLRGIYRCLQNLKSMKLQANNHLECAECISMAERKIWQSSIKMLEKQIAKAKAEALKIIENDAIMKKQYDDLQTVVGIGQDTAIAILAEIPEIKEFRNARQLAAYAGLTPKQHTSGSSVHKKSKISKIGSANFRKILYFPAIVAKNHNPVIKSFCENLKSRGKHNMQIVCAAMRKLCHIIFAILKQAQRSAANAPLNSAVVSVALL